MKNIIKLLSLMLAFVLLLGVAGCTDKTDTASKKPSKDKTSSLVSDGSSSENSSSDDTSSEETNSSDDTSASSTPDVSDNNDVTSSENKAPSDSESKVPAVKREGVTYYVAADGKSETGTSATAPMSLETANKKKFADNDRILLKRGDVFYGYIDFDITVASEKEEDRVYVGAYGSGADPVVSLAKIISDPASFAKQGEFYVADLTDNSKYKGYMNEGTADLSIRGVNNVGFFMTENRTVFPSLKPQLDKCVNEYDFHCKDGKIFIKTDKNPVTALGTLYFATQGSLVRMRSRTEYCDLTLRLGSAHGMNKGENETHDIYIHDMVIEYIGGALQFESSTDTNMIRYGNGIEFYNGPVENILIENCIIRHCYDVAFTMQGNSLGYKDVKVRNCVTYANKQSSEIFHESYEDGVVGYEFYNNLCINSGRGWGHEVFNARTGVPCEFLFYNYFSEEIDIKFYNNIIFNPIRLYWWAGTTNNMKQFNEGVQSYKNSLYLGKIQLFNQSFVGQLGSLRDIHDKEILSKHHSLLGADMEVYSDMITAADTSYDIDQIRKAAASCGVK